MAETFLMLPYLKGNVPSRHINIWMVLTGRPLLAFDQSSAALLWWMRYSHTSQLSILPAGYVVFRDKSLRSLADTPGSLEPRTIHCMACEMFLVSSSPAHKIIIEILLMFGANNTSINKHLFVKCSWCERSAKRHAFDRWPAKKLNFH